MTRLRLDLDEETFLALLDRALRERRSPTAQAEVILRQALGLPFPYPPYEPNEAVTNMARTSLTPAGNSADSFLSI